MSTKDRVALKVDRRDLEKEEKVNEERLGREEREDGDDERFIFVYRCDNKLYYSLKDIQKEDGKTVIIYPVYYEEYEGNLAWEEIRYSSVKKTWIPEDPNSTWLDVIYKESESVYPFTENVIVQQDDICFHCENCLLDYLSREDIMDLVQMSGRKPE